jgi:hypothetical protein
MARAIITRDDSGDDGKLATATAASQRVEHIRLAHVEHIRLMGGCPFRGKIP